MPSGTKPTAPTAPSVVTDAGKLTSKRKSDIAELTP